MIGVSAAANLKISGRVTGISGILHRSIVSPVTPVAGLDEHDSSPSWRRAFMGGLLGAGAVAGAVAPDYVFGHMADYHISNFGLVAGGLAVGVGTRLGSGCTSGHGVCGLARLSPRSAAAVATFMTTGFGAAWSARHVDALQPLLRGEKPIPIVEIEAEAAVAQLLQDQDTAAGDQAGSAEGAMEPFAIGLENTAAYAMQYTPSLAQVPLGVAAPAAVGAISIGLAALSHRDSRALLRQASTLQGTGTGGGGGQGGEEGYEGPPSIGASGNSSAGAGADAGDPERNQQEVEVRQVDWLRSRAFADTAISYGLGVSFGGGLILSGMADPVKVISFLDVQHPGGWDPSLAFVMGGAAGVALPVFQQVLAQ